MESEDCGTKERHAGRAGVDKDGFVVGGIKQLPISVENGFCIYAGRSFVGAESSRNSVEPVEAQERTDQDDGQQ